MVVRDYEGYTVLERPGHGAVAVLPFQHTPDGIMILARYEPIPADKFQYRLVCLSGGVEEGETPVEGARRETYEESGYLCKDFIDLGTAYTSKWWSTPLHLFAVDVTGMTPDQPPGDGSVVESLSGIKWLTFGEAVRVDDAPFLACLARFEI